MFVSLGKATQQMRMEPRGRQAHWGQARFCLAVEPSPGLGWGKSEACGSCRVVIEAETGDSVEVCRLPEQGTEWDSNQEPRLKAEG